MIRIITFIIICSFNIITSFAKVKPERIKKDTPTTTIIINNNKYFHVLKKDIIKVKNQKI